MTRSEYVDSFHASSILIFFFASFKIIGNDTVC